MAVAPVRRTPGEGAVDVARSQILPAVETPIIVEGGTAVETSVANAGTPVGFAPDQIAGLEAWLEADAIGGADGDPVTTWQDSHTSNNDATGATGQTLQTNEINGLPVVRFDGVDDFMVVNNIVANDATRTIFFVGRSLAAGYTAGDGFFGFTAQSELEMAGASAGVSQFRWVQNQAGSNVLFGGVPTTTAHVFTLRFNSATSADGYVDSGSATNFDPDNNYQASGTSSFAIAAKTEAGSTPGNIEVGEVLVYDSALSDTDLDTVRQYLSDKWLAETPIVVSGDTASETDTAPAGTVAKTVSGATGAETSVANAGTVVKPIVVSGGIASETDVANAGTGLKTVAGATGVETDVANAGTVVKPITVSGGTASESDTAPAGTSAKTVSGGTAAETDVANAGTVIKPIVVSGATASEVDTAPPGNISGGGGTTVNGSTATETDAVNAGTTFKIVTGATATEASVVNAGTIAKIVLGGTAVESDVANAGTGPLQGGTAIETDFANAGTVSGGAQPPDTSPTLGGYFDETVTGGVVVETRRGGNVLVMPRGGNIAQGPRGGEHDETTTGGSHDETPTGGLVH
jgi:hypothetical protein